MICLFKVKYSSKIIWTYFNLLIAIRLTPFYLTLVSGIAVLLLMEYIDLVFIVFSEILLARSN